MIFVTLQDEKQLCPFRQMARLIAPRPKNVGFVVAIVFPIDGPIGMVMFPDESSGKLRLALSNMASNQQGALQVATFSCRFERGDQSFTAMHIGILAAVRKKCFPIAVRLIGIQA